MCCLRCPFEECLGPLRTGACMIPDEELVRRLKQAYRPAGTVEALKCVVREAGGGDSIVVDEFDANQKQAGVVIVHEDSEIPDEQWDRMLEKWTPMGVKAQHVSVGALLANFEASFRYRRLAGRAFLLAALMIVLAVLGWIR